VVISELYLYTCARLKLFFLLVVPTLEELRQVQCHHIRKLLLKKVILVSLVCVSCANNVCVGCCFKSTLIVRGGVFDESGVTKLLTTSPQDGVPGNNVHKTTSTTSMILMIS
jgi:hypothetical protein